MMQFSHHSHFASWRRWRRRSDQYRFFQIREIKRLRITQRKKYEQENEGSRVAREIKKSTNLRGCLRSESSSRPFANLIRGAVPEPATSAPPPAKTSGKQRSHARLHGSCDRYALEAEVSRLPARSPAPKPALPPVR